MTFAELLAALALMALFLSGLSGAVMPAVEAGRRAEKLYEQSFEACFVIDSFRSACRSGSFAFEEWSRAVSVVNGLEDLSVVECAAPAAAEAGKRILKMTFSLGGKTITVYAEVPLA